MGEVLSVECPFGPEGPKCKNNQDNICNRNDGDKQSPPYDSSIHHCLQHIERAAENVQGVDTLFAGVYSAGATKWSARPNE